MFLKFSRNPIKSVLGLIAYLWKETTIATIAVVTVYVAYELMGIKALGMQGAIPLGVLGTALAIFLGFRNNSAYDRWWEGRKIWGGLVNISRTLGAQVITYVTPKHIKDDSSLIKDGEIHRELIYRHIAYLYALSLHLRKQQDQYEEVLAPYLRADELKEVLTKRNVPTQLNFHQSRRLKEILKDNLIEDFRLYEMMHSIETIYELQGKCERIKNTPFPLYYSMFTRQLLYLFIFFLPLSVIGAFQKMSTALHTNLTWLVIPICILTAMGLSVIERTARTTENPFENYYGDVPMTGLCRTIEIDLREMLGEEDIPPSQPIERPGRLNSVEVLR